MDILNFISWIRGGRQVTSVDPDKTLVPIGIKDSRRDDGYLAAAITVTDLANYICDGGCTPLEAIGVADVTQENLFGNPYEGVNMIITCRDVLPDVAYSVVTFINQQSPLPVFSFENWSQIIDFLNTAYASIGTFTYLGGTSIQLTTNTEYIPCIDPEVIIEFAIAP
jgi:hypothetical protein